MMLLFGHQSGHPTLPSTSCSGCPLMVVLQLIHGQQEAIDCQPSQLKLTSST